MSEDIKLLSQEDKTLVGENGLTLSGGQKSRLSLARALYADADIYLIDDVLSALDAKIVKRVFEKSILQLFEKKKRIVIMVTHQI